MCNRAQQSCRVLQNPLKASKEKACGCCSVHWVPTKPGPISGAVTTQALTQKSHLKPLPQLLFLTSPPEGTVMWDGTPTHHSRKALKQIFLRNRSHMCQSARLIFKKPAHSLLCIFVAERRSCSQSRSKPGNGPGNNVCKGKDTII